MKRMMIPAVVALLVFGVTAAFAGTQDGAVVALHAGPHLQSGDTPCDWGGVNCSNFVIQWPLQTPANLYLIIAWGNPDPGVGGLSCGILYNGGATGGSTMSDQVGVDVYSWTLCATGFEIPGSPNGVAADQWPASGGGNRLMWDVDNDCQTTVYSIYGVHALAGSFYVYAYTDDVFEITENNLQAEPPEFQVGDCNRALSDLNVDWQAGAVAFGSSWVGSRNPCWISPVKSATWGEIKTKY